MEKNGIQKEIMMIFHMVSKKIILASDYLGSVYHYMDYKLSQH